jgi:hypothetical protein
MLASAVMQRATLRGAIAEFLATNLDGSADHCGWSSTRAMMMCLIIALDEHRFEIEPVSSVRSNRVDLAVRIWDDGRAGERITVRVSPTIYLPVVLMQRDVSRGSIVTEDDIEVVHQWLQPVHGGLVTSETDAVGRIAAFA